MMGRRWWVAHTKPRQEKCLARQSSSRGIPYYLPLLPRRDASRRQTSYVPMFPGYVFFNVSPEERLAALTTNRIVRLLDVCDRNRATDKLDSRFKRQPRVDCFAVL